MKTVMKKSDLFCLKNWKIYSNSIRIKIDTYYPDSTLNESIVIEQPDNTDNNYRIEGLVIRIEREDNGKIFIGSSGKAERFEVTIENASSSVSDMGLEYMIISALDAAQKIERESFPFRFDRIVFTSSESGFDVELTVNDSVQDTAEVNTAAEIRHRTKDDLIGDIKADLKMMSYFRNISSVKEVKAKLNILLEQADVMSEDEMAVVLAECEDFLLKTIVGSREDIQKYREHI